MSASGEISGVLSAIAKREKFTLREYSALYGGSINEVLLLKTSAGKKVLKLNNAAIFPEMFRAEKEGLETLRKVGSFKIPKVYAEGEIDNKAYLLLEYIEEGKSEPQFWDTFAENLATLHKNSADYYGFPSPNYIGSLPQTNEKSTSASGFYIEQRLKPQLKMAADNGFPFQDLDIILKNISAEIPDEKSALIHGDLWSGNYIINSSGFPSLIDPAVCYASKEMDLAMMKLFGGFPELVFNIYEEIFPLLPDSEKRVPLWQLYYLLVHLNIFGQGYYPQVKNILNNFL